MGNIDENKANVCNALNVLTYTDCQYDLGKENSIGIRNFLTHVEAEKGNIPEVEALNEMLDNTNTPDLAGTLAGMTIVAQSHYDDSSNSYSFKGAHCTEDPIQAYAFKDAQRNLYIAYRGTGNGRWQDNGQGLYDPSTDMQDAAKEFAESCIEKYGNDAPNIYITGHSKGGNEAQYVTLTAKNRDRITSCYSEYGQGFSQDFWLKHRNDSELSKMYSINGDNDPVHQLGHVIIPYENTVYVRTNWINNEGKYSIANCHDLLGGMKDGKLNFYRDDNGNVIRGEEGPFIRLAKTINKNLQALPPDVQESCEKALMKLIDNAKGGSLDYGEVGFLDYLIFDTFGLALIGYSIQEFYLKEAYDEGGAIGVLGAVIIVALCQVALCLFIDLGIKILAGYELVQELTKIIVKAKTFLQNAETYIIDFYNSVCRCVSEIKEWFFTHSPGFSFATYNPDVVVDTDSMHFISACLSNISSRAKDLDSRMNSLYFEMGINWDTIFNIGCLLKAGIVLDYSYRLDWCAGYLDETANEFESVEGQLIH